VSALLQRAFVIPDLREVTPDEVETIANLLVPGLDAAFRAEAARVGGIPEDVTEWIAARQPLDQTLLYRYSNVHPRGFADSLAGGTTFYAAAFAAGTAASGIKETLSGFSQQSKSGFLYRFPSPGGLALGKKIPMQFWRGVASGQEVVVSHPTLQSVEVKLGNRWMALLTVPGVPSASSPASGASEKTSI